MRFHVHIIFFSLFVLFVGNSSSAMGASAKAGSEESRQKLKISDVSISASKFNPRIGERVEIKFSLSKDARVTLKIFDPDFELVKTLLEKENKKAGAHKVTWDGKDIEGSLVPDEAYFFTIEAKDKEGNLEVYDPITFSGGEVYGVAQADLDKENNKIRYTLEHAGRVLIRMGLFRGPLMRTLVDQEPRPSGLNTESWDGKDESRLVDLKDNPSFLYSITYFTLPENSLITVGNDKVSYYVYKTGLKTKRPKKEDRGRTIISNRAMSPHFSQPRITYLNPKIQVTFPEAKKATDHGWPVIEGATVVRVAIDEKDKEVIKDRKLEVYFFLDHRFLVEKENAQMPYDFHWDFYTVVCFLTPLPGLISRARAGPTACAINIYISFNAY